MHSPFSPSSPCRETITGHHALSKVSQVMDIKRACHEVAVYEGTMGHLGCIGAVRADSGCLPAHHLAAGASDSNAMKVCSPLHQDVSRRCTLSTHATRVYYDLHTCDHRMLTKPMVGAAH